VFGLLVCGGLIERAYTKSNKIPSSRDPQNHIYIFRF
jgi:hypothetical protein